MVRHTRTGAKHKEQGKDKDQLTMRDIYDSRADRYPPVPEDVKRRLEMSARDYGVQQSRALRCPRCGYFLMEIPSDMAGVISIKCHKCKGIFRMNTSYFRTQRRTYRHIRWALHGRRKRIDWLSDKTA